MELVEGDLRVGKVRLHARDERRLHVDRGVGDVLSLAAMRTDHVYEQADVVVAPTRRRLIRRDLFDLAEIDDFFGD
jgi:hypothetical protein